MTSSPFQGEDRGACKRNCRAGTAESLPAEYRKNIMEAQNFAAAFAGLIDLAAERVGGKALSASDEFFAE